MTTESTDAVPQATTPVATARSKAWPAFTEKLAAALRALEEDQHLILCVKRSSRYVQFAGQGSFGLRAETASNHYLKDEPLDEAQVHALAQAGWLPPTRDPRASTPEADPDGSPNFFIDFSAPVDCDAVAQLAVHTLCEILHVPHPGFLTYDALQSGNGGLEIPGLGLKRYRPAPQRERAGSLRESLLACVRRRTGIDTLEFDRDGDISLSFRGHASVLRIVRDGRFVRIFTVMASGVEDSPRVLDLMNDLNRTVPRIQFWFYRDAILADIDVAAVPFVDEHLAEAMDEFCSTTHRISLDLAEKLAEAGGRPAGPPRTLH